MKRALQKHRRLFATGILFAFVLTWVVPVQACFPSAAQSGTTAQSSCPDCASPYPCDTEHCSPSVATSCGSAMLTAAAIPPQTLDKAMPPPATLETATVRRDRVLYTPAFLPDPPGVRPTLPVNIRFCTFLE